MPQIKPGHRLYLYRLFKQELGCGKQTALARAAEVLEQDGLAPEDLGCSDARQLFEQLTECVKVTVFKKGAIFVTLQANADYDRALEKAASGKPSAAEKAVSNGKSWKKKRGAKELKPLRPKHIEKKPEKVEPEPVKEQPAEKAEAKAEAAVEAATLAAPEAPAEAPVANEPQVAAASVPEPEPEPIAEPRQPGAEVEAEAEPLSEPTEAEDKSVDADAARKAETPEAPEAPKLDHEPPIKFTITYTPEPQAAPEPQPMNEPQPKADAPDSTGPKHEPGRQPAVAQSKPAVTSHAPKAPEAPKPETPKPRPESKSEPQPKPNPVMAPAPAPAQTTKPAKPQKPEPAPAHASAPEPSPTPEPAPTPAHSPAKKPARAHNDLPHDFYAEVRCPDEHLSALCQLLPLDVDPMATLEEDFRIARSTGKLRGTRSSVTFPLRFQRSNGKPVIVKLRRTATPFAGKRWALAGVEADSPEEVGFGALERKAAGPWAAFANDDQLKHAVSPADELAQSVVLGSWDALLSELAALAAPEDWGEKNGLLREYMAMRWHRAKSEKLISMADDGSSAAFDTGLLTAGGEPIGAILEPHDGDIVWELTCFSTNAAARPATWPQMPATEQIAQALLAQNDPGLRRCAQLVSRNPRTATQAYDPVNEAVYVLVPARGGALALDLCAPDAPRVVGTATLADASACARVVSADQPAWLRA